MNSAQLKRAEPNLDTSTSPMPRILYLTPGCFDKGGISRYCRYQINALREIVGEKNVRVLSLQGPDKDAFESDFSVAWHSGVGGATLRNQLRFVAYALREVLIWRPQIIFCAHVNYTPVVSRLARLCDAAPVLNVYGLELWSGLSTSRTKHMKRMNYVIADCHATANHVRDQNMHPLPPEVIWDCVDLQRFSPGPPAKELVERLNIPLEERRIVLTLGRLAVAARHKGYDRLIEIWGDILERVPDAHLIFAGRGDDAERLKSKTAEMGLNESVTFTGSIDEGDLASIYRIASVFCLVSDKGPGRGEGIPLTPLEALATGVPILVGDEDGSLEAVDNARNGFVVSPRDLASMTEALVTLLSEPRHIHAHRRTEARAVAEERFGYTAFVTKHRDFLDKIKKYD